MESYLSLDELLTLSKEYNLIPIYKEFIADLETPVSLFMKLYKDKEYSFLLDSVTGGESIGRYSFLGSDPAIIFRAKYNICQIIEYGTKHEFETKDPIRSLKKIINRYKAFSSDEIKTSPFHGGAVGYFSYDSIRIVEKLPDTNEDDLNIPHINFIFPKHIISLDHVTNKVRITYNIDTRKYKDTKSLKAEYEKGKNTIESLYLSIKSPLALRDNSKETQKPLEKVIEEDIEDIEKIEDIEQVVSKASFTESEYKAAVRKAKEYIRQGDIFQVQISRRLEHEVKGIEHFTIYRALRSINPSPYLFYLKFNDIEIIGSSPELLVKKEGDKVIARPIAGTRGRGKTKEYERRMELELASDEKELAEHIMLVDLGRNDLGRVCKFGSVRLAHDGLKEKLMYPEKYSHVIHLVSEIEGILKDDKDMFDLFLSSFPAGTLTGAPKIRAMEIIEELEPIKRGLYGGGVAYFGFNGDMDSCIIIRTIVIKGNKAYIQTAGGVVYDSKEELEFLETKNKAKAMLKAISLSYKMS